MKKYLGSMIGLLIVMVGLMVTLRVLGKLPVVGKAATAAHELAIDGHL